MSETNKQVVRGILEECMNQGRMERLGELIADSYVSAQGQRGPAGFGATLQALKAAFPDIHYTLEDVLAEGDRVSVRWQWRGTHQHPFNGRPASHLNISNDGIGIFHLEDGKITHAWLQTDRLGFLQEIGVVPKNVGAAPTPTAART